MLSYWEKYNWFDTPDYTIIGAGIVGLITSILLKKKKPSAQILILERGSLPNGASTKNAGFSCFGTVGEIVDDFTLSLI